MASRTVETADSFQAIECECGCGHRTVLLLDDKGEVYAEADIGNEKRVDDFIVDLLAGWDRCLSCIVERLEGLLDKVRTEAKEEDADGGHNPAHESVEHNHDTDRLGGEHGTVVVRRLYR
jgi:hypothetical protein